MFKRLLAYFRLNSKLICQLSNNKKDYHDYSDSLENMPMHFYKYQCNQCKRCNKTFEI